MVKIKTLTSSNGGTKRKIYINPQIIFDLDKLDIHPEDMFKTNQIENCGCTYYGENKTVRFMRTFDQIIGRRLEIRQCTL